MRQLVVGVGEGEVSRDPDTVIVTYALGSCVAVTMHDPIARVAGMVHFMLPESSMAGEKSSHRPWIFADTGISSLLRAALEQGADKRRLIIVTAGGAQLMNDAGMFDIGKRNCLAVRKALSNCGLVAHAEETGGTVARTLRIEVATGRVWLHVPGEEIRQMNPRPSLVPCRPIKETNDAA